MTVIRAILIAFICTCVAGGAARLVDAKTPTPTATSVTPATVTPSPPQPAMFAGHVWVNARVVDDAQVTAKIGDAVCGTSHAIVSTGGVALFALPVAAQEAVPGCGFEGATITFFVGDRQASQTATWHAGSEQFLNPIVGPPFARFFISNAEVERVKRAGGSLKPYVGNAVCGYGEVVYSNQQESGCGVDGSQITFRLLDAQGNVTAVANEKGVWHAWDGVSDPQQLNLTFGPPSGIRVANTGTGHASSDGAFSGGWAVLLGFAGLAGVGLGFGLRRRAMTR